MTERRGKTYKWLFGGSCLLIVAIVPILISHDYGVVQSVQADVKALQETKADKEYVDRLYNKVDDLVKNGERMEIMMATHIAATGAGRIPPKDR